MTEPWIKRKAGELLTSAAWNDMQSQARQELLAIPETIRSTLASLRDRLSPARERQECRVSVGYTDGNLESFRLPLSLQTRCMVILQADLWAVTSGNAGENPLLELLFILHQGNKKAPARLMPLDPSSTYAKDWPGEPNASRWPEWLEYHNDFFTKYGWPRTGINHALGFGGDNTFSIPVCLEESVELPPGVYAVQLAVIANSNIRFNHGCVRVITIPS